MTSTTLKRGMGLTGVIALGLGTAVGVSIFSVIAPATAVAGPAMLAAVAIAAVPMFILALTYAFMGSAVPTAGASYEWVRRFVSPDLAFFTAWLRIASSTGAMLILALVLTRYLSMVIPIQTKPTMLVLFILVFGVNMIGVKAAARVQTVLMGLLLVIFAVFAIWGAPAAAPQAFLPFMPSGWAGVLAATPLLIGLFFGIETATEVGEEVKDGRRAIPMGIAVSILAAVALYLAVAATALGVLGPERLAASETPLLDAAAVFMGQNTARLVIVLAAVVAIGKSLNGLCLIFSRYLYAMGRAQALPGVLGRVNARFGTPHVALMTAFACCLFGLLLPMNLTSLFLAVNIPSLIQYGATCLAAVRVVRHRPDLYTGAAFKLGRRTTQATAWLGVAAAAVVVLMGLTTDRAPYIALAAWGAVGALYYIVGGRRRKVRAAASLEGDDPPIP